MGILRGGIITTSAGGGAGSALPSGTSGILSVNSEYGPHITLSSDASIQITKPSTNNIQFSCSGFVSGVQQQIEAKLAVSGQEILSIIDASGQSLLSINNASGQYLWNELNVSGQLLRNEIAESGQAILNTISVSGQLLRNEIAESGQSILSEVNNKPDKYYGYFNNFGSGYFNHGLNTQFLTWNVYASGTTVEAIDPDRFRVMDDNHIFLKLNSPETGFIVIMG